ncbi:MAG: SDR family NAD(P)-dependent oxidoreductase [Bacteroidetes bacterium]|jgi:3-oxoacyl-[acyl-carrier protein] reductase|nr:SDR family NAD(P)-dependent oxidoreductase [Bacteroidota bacterium]
MNKKALITGASKGIGKAITCKLAENGYDLIITGRDSERLDHIKKELQQFKVKIYTVIADFAEQSAIEHIRLELEQQFGQLDVLINNAGMAISKTIEETTIQDWELLMNVNARSPFFLTQACIPYLKKSPAATVVNISSVVGRLGYNKQSAYSASKHALNGFSKVLAKELQPFDIRVHNLAPGGVNTDMVRNMRPDIETQHLILPEEMAEITWFLITHRGNAMIDNINIRRANGNPWV